MSQIKSAVKILREDGSTMLFCAFLTKYFLENQKVAPYTRKLHKEIHQSVSSYPKLGYWPKIRNPVTFNEKILHRMLFASDEKYTTAFDKLASRKYVSVQVGEHVLPEILHITDDPQEIPFDSLPDSYVIKSSLGSGEIELVHSSVNKNDSNIRTKCGEWISKDYHFEYATMGGHYCFKFETLRPKIIVEEMLKGTDQNIPRDYKFYVFHGDVEYVHVDFNRFGERSVRFFDSDWNSYDFRKGGRSLGPITEKPSKYDEMVRIAELLGESYDFIRVDLYNTKKGVKFGELTPNPGAGRSAFNPKKWDFEFGELW